MIEKYKSNKNVILLLLGTILISCIVVPYLCLGEASYVQIHDQVDGEILNYIYQAKYFNGGNSIPEFLNGMDKVAMTLPAPFGVLFYMILKPFQAYVFMQTVVLGIGFIGMYYLCKELEVFEEIGCIVSILFCYMPFYPTYGLSILGQPLLVWSFLHLWKGQKKKRALCAIVIVAGFSSFTLVGFFFVILAIILTVFSIFRKKENSKELLWGSSLLLGTYMLTNFSLINRIFFENEFISHREEMVIQPLENWGRELLELWFVGGAYSPVYSKAISIYVLVISITFFVYQGKNKKLFRNMIFFMLGLVAGIFLLSCLAIMWKTILVDIRIEIGGFIQSFQADRVYWVFPFIWMLVLAFILQILWKSILLNEKKWIKFIIAVFFISLCMIQGYQVFRDSTLNKNIRLLLDNNYDQITWESIYMPEVFVEIKEALNEELESDFSVVSLGIYPSAALYNGFTCADGYSNNYHLSYKHAFREVIAAELAKNEEVRRYFDEWGNRLYFVESEYGFNTLIHKEAGISYENVDFDLEAMKVLNIQFIFSAAPIQWGMEIGDKIVEVSGSPFDSVTSYYEVWVYKIL